MANSNINQLKDHAQKLLKIALNNNQADFREGQWDSIEKIVKHRQRLLVVQRTGWGKSIVYFLSTSLLRKAGEGPTIVISPLLALIRNQLEAAKRLGLNAATINSDNRNNWTKIERNFLNNQLDVLFISPERLANEKFRQHVLIPAMEKLGLGLFVVDEAHCISDWGHDFRPDYRRIVRLLQALPANVPALATTATANNRVVRDIEQQLGSTLKIIRGCLIRNSLRLQNIVLPSKAERMAWLANYIPKLPGSGIIYTLTVRDAKQLANWLQTQNIQAESYYGGKNDDVSRADLEQDLLDNQLKVLVATTALGMGFDKPDLGFVIHFQRPGSVVHYYQQVGRAGRAIEQAYGILLSGQEDEEIIDYFIETAFPPQRHIADILAALDDSNGLSMANLEKQVNLRRNQITKALKVLSVESPSPVEKRDSTWYRTPVAYIADQKKISHLTNLRRAEQQQMTEYVHTSTCLMQFLQQALDDPDTQPCGRCASCLKKELISTQVDPNDVQAAINFLKRSHILIEPRKRWPAGNIFSVYPWRSSINKNLQAETGYALCLWGDPGWGELVKQGKQQQGNFDEQLVKAAAHLVQDHWQPNPYPTWVTCIPSLNHTELVPDFAQRLAQTLKFPFQPCISKIKETASQKEMQNSYQQAHNLDGAFQITSWSGIKGPVLLVDDMVDSKWTMTVVAALLREAGSGPVYPLALANTAKG